MQRHLFRIALCALLAILGPAPTPAQAPTVPTDHYGPPSCPGVKPPSYRDREAIARAEQKAGAVDSRALPSAEPLENFDLARYKLEDYDNCIGPYGCYWADIDAQYKRAEAALRIELKTVKQGEKPAVVFDIDETALSSYCEMQREDYGYIKKLDDAWTVSPEAAVAIPGALRLFKEAQDAGAAVFFITGRPGVPDKPSASSEPPQPDQTAATARNLKAAGFHGWAGLALRNGPENEMPTIQFKSAERQKIVDSGYRIVLSVGDQWSDLLGQPRAGISIKLPDPFYFIP